MMEGDLVKFMQQMQLKISQDILDSNEALRKEINEGRKEVREEMSSMNKKIEEVKEDTKQVKDEARRNKTENLARLQKLEGRMTNIEGRQKKVVVEEINARKTVNEAIEEIETDSYREKVVKKKACKDQEVGQEVKEIEYKSSWAKQVSQISLENQLKMANEAISTGRTDVQAKPVTRKVNDSKPLVMGDSGKLHAHEDWPWDESESEWDGTEDRVQRNKEKQKREKERRLKNVQKAAKVGRCTIEVGPIKKESYDYFYKITSDFDEAKKLAAVEYMEGYLEFDHEDMNDYCITDTKISGKGDNILYIVFDSPTKVKNVRRRIADLQNPLIKTRDYIPPQFFKCYETLSRSAADSRRLDPQLKTQIRFENDDICLYTKEKGTEGPFEPEDMTKFDLPAIQHSIKWTRKPDRPAWQQVKPQRNMVQLKSLGNKTKASSGQGLDGDPRSKKQKITTEDNLNSGSRSDGSPACGKMDVSNEEI